MSAWLWIVEGFLVWLALGFAVVLVLVLLKLRNEFGERD